MASVGAPWRKDVLSRQKALPIARALTSRRAAMAGGLGALALALAGCSEDPPTSNLVFVPPPAPPPRARSDFRNLVEGGHAALVAGQHMNLPLQQRFYAKRGYEPVWTKRRQEQANALLEAVQRAGDHGLDPDLFHVGLLRDHGASLSALQQEFLLTDAFLTYADALARGAVTVERRRDDQVLAPEPVDVAAVLDDAIGEDDPGRAIESLAPTSLTYLALRTALQNTRGSSAPGAVNRTRTIAVNMERQRWLPRRLPANRVWVNVADERLTMYRDGQAAFSTRVVVGEDIQQNQSPEFRAAIDASFYNPPWVVPADITKAEILPKVEKDPTYLTKNKMILLASGEAEQLPGPDAGLGLIMFDMPNKFDVYLHDTPDRATIFNRDNRRISHGCIRVRIAADSAPGSAMAASGCRIRCNSPPC